MQNNNPRFADAFTAPWASAHGHTLPDLVRKYESQHAIAMQATIIVKMPTTGNPG